MGKLSDLFNPSAAKERRMKAELAKRLNGKPLKCVCERINGVEEIIARDGAIVMDSGDIVIYGGTDPVFRADFMAVNAGELLSLEGLVVQGIDRLSGCDRSIVAYYKYWRNVSE